MPFEDIIHEGRFGGLATATGGIWEFGDGLFKPRESKVKYLVGCPVGEFLVCKLTY